MTRLDARDVSVAFGDRTVLERITVSFGKGALTGLIGPNGAGKTTLLRALIGVQALRGGSVSWDGTDTNRLDQRRLAREIAYLPQGGVCHWPLSVERVVALGRLPHQAPWQKPSREDRAAVEAAMIETDVADLRARTVTTLSGGERMRVLLARALATVPAMLLADEPVASLDPYHQLHVMTLLKAMTGRGAGAIVVLHDLTLAARFCDRLVLLAEGRVVGDGAPDDVLSADNLAASYHVAAVRGVENGEPYILPWRYLDRDAPPPGGR
ncbi:MAG: ABC transporter ATP-binding protein [Rhodospirillales bacterium]